MTRFLLLAALSILAMPASAQLLPSGTWAGTWSSGRTAQPASAEIERCATGIRVALVAGGRTAHTETGTWSQRRLRFTTDRVRMPGMAAARPLACDLAMGADGRLSGMCIAGRARYPVTLAPPAAGAFGCD